MSVKDYIANGFAAWLVFHIMTNRGALLELVVMLLFWPLVAMVAIVIGLACWAAGVREWIVKRWKK